MINGCRKFWYDMADPNYESADVVCAFRGSIRVELRMKVNSDET